MEQDQQTTRSRHLLGLGLCLLLVVSILVAMVPQPGQAATATPTKRPTTIAATKTPTPKSGKTSKKPSMAVSFENNYITVDVANFPSLTNYYVRAEMGNMRVNQWFRLGRLRTNKNGSAQVTYRAPVKIREASMITVCVKNVMTDGALCQIASR